jgi:NADH:ubiquinone oxidoreductase subunit 4 (subunit M)
MWPLLLFMVGFGVYPTPILNLINSATVALIGRL